MSRILCASCGSNAFVTNGMYRVCQFCNTSYEIRHPPLNPINPIPSNLGKTNQNSTVISLQSDIQRLLEKCRKDPSKAYKYAGLILDIDPSNKEALKYL